MSNITIGLMVKNEAPIIERCLISILPIHPDLVVILDTGSSDDTIIKAGLFLQKHKINYKIYFTQFVDFSTTRNELLNYIRQESSIDYILMIDADDILDFEVGFNAQKFKEGLNKNYYQIEFKMGTVVYHLPKLISNKKNYNYVGVTHEFLTGDNFTTNYNICKYFKMIQINDSARRISGAKTNHDIELLKKGIIETTDEYLKTRYTFYLAQGYYDRRDYINATQYYLERTKMEGWNEEIFYSYYKLGLISAQIDVPDVAKIIFYHLFAYHILPTRIESLVALKTILNKCGYTSLNDILQPIINKTPKPEFGLFIEENKYVKTN